MSNFLLTTVGSGSFVKPVGIKKIIVECWGGGGAGCGYNHLLLPVSYVGGAGGSYARTAYTVSREEITYPYIVAFGGTGSIQDGQSGGYSTFGSSTSSVYVRAEGGSAGTRVAGTGNTKTFRYGSIANTVGDVKYRGGNSVGWNLYGKCMGGGGAGSLGNGGDADSSEPPLGNFLGGTGTQELGGNGGASLSVDTSGSSGLNYGGGGSGVIPVIGGVSLVGGAGARGAIRITFVDSSSIAISKIEWDGNTLNFGYELDNVVSYAATSDASQFVRIENGDEYAWVPNTNYILEGDVRWIPTANGGNPTQTGWDGATGWRAFLEYARAKNKFKFYEDNRFNSYIESYLVDPLNGEHELEPDGTRKIRLVIRNSTTPYDGY
jgi:hypothetical protein